MYDYYDFSVIWYNFCFFRTALYNYTNPQEKPN